LLLGTQRVRDDGALEIGGVSAPDLARRYGTPLYVVDEAEVRRRCREYRDSLAAAYSGPSAVAYASKAFQTLALCRVVEQEGLWLDVASGGELHCALSAGFPAGRILMHGNNKSLDELAMAIAAPVGLVVVDCCEEIERIAEVAGDRRVPTLLRLTPGIDCHVHEYVKTGRADSKFGLGIEDGSAMEGVRRALACRSIDLRGFNCHIGSQILVLDGFADAVQVMLDFCRQVKAETGLEPTVFDIGGGLGVRHRSDERPPTIPELTAMAARTLADGWRAAGFSELPMLMIEPGRSIVGEAGTILYTVGAVKKIHGIRTYVAVDGGLSDNPRPALYGARYTVLAANKMTEPAGVIVTVAGKHCETDTLFPDVPVPESLSPGDLLAVPACGGYTFAMASNYNRLTRPAVVHVMDGRAEVVVERQSYDQLLIGESIPERLR